MISDQEYKFLGDISLVYRLNPIDYPNQLVPNRNHPIQLHLEEGKKMKKMET